MELLFNIEVQNFQKSDYLTYCTHINFGQWIHMQIINLIML